MYFIETPFFPTTNYSVSPTPFFNHYTIKDLPKAYLHLLEEQNGGYLTKNALPTSEPTRDGLDMVAIHTILGIQKEGTPSILEQKELHEAFHLPDYFIVFSYQNEQFFGFDYSILNANEEPKIRYIDTDTDQWLYLADSFEEFLVLLRKDSFTLNDAKELSLIEANHIFLIGENFEIEELLTRFETTTHKEWYFNWLAYLAKSDQPPLVAASLQAFETQVFYFHSKLPESVNDLVSIFLSLETQKNSSTLVAILKELNEN